MKTGLVQLAVVKKITENQLSLQPLVKKIKEGLLLKQYYLQVEQLIQLPKEQIIILKVIQTKNLDQKKVKSRTLKQIIIVNLKRKRKRKKLGKESLKQK